MLNSSRADKSDYNDTSLKRSSDELGDEPIDTIDHKDKNKPYINTYSNHVNHTLRQDNTDYLEQP